MSNWDFGGAFADTAGKLLNQDIARQRAPIALAHEQATTRLNNANASVIENRLSADKEMAQIMRGVGFDPEEPQSTSLMKMATAAMKAGDATTAREVMLRASQARAAESNDAYRTAQTDKARTDQAIKLTDRYANLVGQAQSQEELDVANFLFEAETGQPGSLQVYDPEAVELLRNSTIKFRDQVYANHTKTMERIAEARLRNTAGYRTQSIALREAELARKKAKDAADTKVGGKDVGAPTRTEITQAGDLLTRAAEAKGLDKETRRTAAFDLASRARALRKANPGLDAGEATERAFREQVAEGFYQTRQATSLWGKITGRTETSYGRPGASIDRPMAVPKDRSTMKPGTFYTTPKGTLQYLGDGKWKVPEAPKGGSATAADDDEDDE